MRVTSIELHPSNGGAPVVMSYRDPKRLNPYNVKSIQGLDADEIVPRYYGGVSQRFFNLAMRERDVVVLLELNPDFGASQSYSSLRDAVAKMIASSRTGSVTLKFLDGASVTAQVTGQITKFEASTSTNTPEIQLTINCKDPMLKSPTPIDVNVAGLFPASTPITDDFSTAPHGFKFEIELGASIPFFRMYDSSTQWEFRIQPLLMTFNAGDKIYFSSELNNKYLYLVRPPSTTIQLGNFIVGGSIWPILFPGTNVFSCDSPSDLVWNAISYSPTYWGI